MDIIEDVFLVFVYWVMRTWKKIFGPHNEEHTKDV